MGHYAFILYRFRVIASFFVESGLFKPTALAFGAPVMDDPL